jgi:hypothetical protein
VKLTTGTPVVRVADDVLVDLPRPDEIDLEDLQARGQHLDRAFVQEVPGRERVGPGDVRASQAAFDRRRPPGLRERKDREERAGPAHG